MGCSACAPQYVPFTADSIRFLGAVAAPGEGVEVALGVGPTWIELDVRNPGASTVWVSLDGVTVTGPDGREHRMVESAALNLVASELAGTHPGFRAIALVSPSAADSPSLGQLRAVGDRTAAIEPGQRALLLLHPAEYIRVDGTGITPFPAPFWGTVRSEEEAELTVVLPVSWGRSWGRVEIAGRVGG
jgi:hypothetical protein